MSLAEEHSAEANAKAEGFRLDIAKANERAAAANETAEKERLARIQLEARFADRVLTVAAQAYLTAVAASIAKGTTVDMCVYGDSLEISSVATSISDRLSAGGWVVHKWQIVAGGSVWGILIGIKPDTGPTLTEVGSKMVSILASSGVGSQLWDFNKLQAGGIPRGPPGELGADIRIFIGSKQ